MSGMGTPLYDVAIVGYGPAGAVAAGLLGQMGHRVYVCDRLPGVYEIPRAIALDHEIMRVFQQLGLEQAVQAHCEPFTPSEYFGVDGQLIKRMTMVAPPYPQGYTPSLVFTQPPVERLLRGRVAALPTVTVALETEVHAVAVGPDGVTLQTRNAQGVGGVVQARYAIACDGGGSTVRGLLNLPLDDLDFDEPWLVVDVRVNDKGLAKLPAVSVQYCEPERPCTYVIGPNNHRRWEISLKPGEDPREVATDAATWNLLSRWITPEDGTLWRQASYRFHALVATRWREGRVFLAGDAAHMQPPFLGQGMCQGVRDVANLSWKLDAVLQGLVAGDAAERLLDSYGAERSAHVRELTTRIKGVGAVICERDPVKARARDAQLLAACGGVVPDTPRQDVLPHLGTGLLAGAGFAPQGMLFPQPWMQAPNGQVRLDTLTGNGWRLVLAPGCAAPATTHPMPWTVVPLGTPGWTECDGVAEAWLQRHQVQAALVRPDNYVYGTATAPTALFELLDSWCVALGHATLETT